MYMITIQFTNVTYVYRQMDGRTDRETTFSWQHHNHTTHGINNTNNL